MSLDSAISGLVARLESVAQRLERVESQLASGGGASAAAPAAAAAGGGDANVSGWYDAFEGWLNSTVQAMKGAAGKIGTPEFQEQVNAFEKLNNELAGFMKVVASSKKPADSDVPELLKGISAAVGEVVAIRDKAGRGNANWNQLSALSELVPGMGWVTVPNTPAPFWKEYMGNSQFYSNKLIREYKGKDEDQMSFVNALHEYHKEMFQFIKGTHTTGLVWNPKGGDAKAAAAGGAAAAPKAAPSAGPPPPMPTAEQLAPKAGAAKSGGGGGAGALFAQINQGGKITSGLKKVDKSQMTHKNPALRGSSKVPAAVPKKAAPKKTFGGGAKKGTPKFELQGNKWVVDFQDDATNLEINDPLVKHTVYMYKCDKSTVKVNGKVNAITLDGCKKCAIIFQDVVASVEVVNCSGVEVQALGKVPSFTVDKCSAIQLVMNDACLDAEIVTAKSDSINVVLPPKDANSDIEELALPEQIKTTISGRKLVSGFVEHV